MKNDINIDERQEIYQRYLMQKGEVQKYKDIIDYFVYLKDDELSTSFPKESLYILKKAISYIREYIKDNNNSDEINVLKMAIEEGGRVLRTSTIL